MSINLNHFRMTQQHSISHLLILILLMIGFIKHAFPQQDETPNVSISGIIHSDEPLLKSFKIYGPLGIVHTAIPQEIAPSRYNFKFQFHVMEFQYVRLFFKAGIESKVLELYLEPDYQLHIEADLEKFYTSVSFSGNGERANRFLYEYHAKFHGDNIQIAYQVPLDKTTLKDVSQYLDTFKEEELDYLKARKSFLTHTFYVRQQYNILYKFENEKVNHFKFKVEYEKLPYSYTLVEISKKNSPENYQVYLVPYYEKYVKNIHDFTFCKTYFKSTAPTERFNCYQESYQDFTRILLQYHLIRSLLNSADFQLGEELYFKYIEHYESSLPPQKGKKRSHELARTYYVLIRRLGDFYKSVRGWKEDYPINPLYLLNCKGEVQSFYQPQPEKYDRENRNYRLLFFQSLRVEIPIGGFPSKVRQYFNKLKEIAETYHLVEFKYIRIDDVQWKRESLYPSNSDYVLDINNYPATYYKDIFLPPTFVLLVSPEGNIIARDPNPNDIEELLNLGIMDRLPPSIHKGMNVFVMLFFITLGGILAVLIYRIRLYFIRKKEEQKRRITELELKAIRSQLNPHFLFNSMSSIQSLISAENPEIASEHLAGLADLMRMVLKHSEKGIISLAEELDAAEKYCQLEALRFNFGYEIDIAPEIDPYLIEVPAMIIQPYIENAILHGISNCNGPCWIRIEASLLNHSLLIVVEDNGIGVMQAEKQGSSGNGMGMKLNRERLALLHHSAGNVQVFDKSELKMGERGTRIEIWLPVEGEFSP